MLYNALAKTHHIAMWWLCSVVSFVVGSASKDNSEYPAEGQYPTTTPSGKQPHWSYRYNPMFSLLLSLTALRQQRFKLQCATVVEPFSSAWPVIATVTRWNPLACVEIVWAICLCCSYLAMPAMLRVVSGLVHLGDGLEWNDYVGNESGVVNTIW